MEINILFIGDVVGEPGLRIVEMLLPNFKREYKIDFCIANGENLADGKGITPETAQRLFNAGVNVITTGNHVWDKLQQVKDYLIAEKYRREFYIILSNFVFVRCLIQKSQN